MPTEAVPSFFSSSTTTHSNGRGGASCARPKLRALLLDGLGDVWRCLDLATFSGELGVIMLFLFRSPLMQDVAAWGVLLHFFKARRGAACRAR